MSSERHVTVVLPTYRRAGSLARLLAELAAQHDPGAGWDVVVVDNDPDGSARVVVDAAASGFPVALAVVVEPASGASHARNRGTAEARGDVVAFIDDDVHPSPTWLSSLVAPIIAGHARATAGRVRLDWQHPRPSWFHPEFDLFLAEFSPSEDARALPRDGWLVTASAAFEADLLRAVGGLDPVLGPRRGVPVVNDDLDLYRRILRHGSDVLYVPDAVVLHDLPASRLTLGYMLRRLYHQGRSDWLLERRKWRGVRSRGLRWGAGRFRTQLSVRRGEGLGRRDVQARTLADFMWAAGFTREAVGALRPSPEPTPPS